MVHTNISVLKEDMNNFPQFHPKLSTLKADTPSNPSKAIPGRSPWRAKIQM